MKLHTSYSIFGKMSLAFLFILSLVMPLQLLGQTYTPKSLHNGPSWSPNGMVIAYAAAHSGDYDVYTIDIWSLEQQRITDHPANDIYPEWAPNGQWLAFYSDRPSEIPPFPPDTVIYNVKGLYETYARDGYRPSWSPDGDRIVAHFRSEEGDYEIYTMNRQGKDRVPITDNQATDVHPRFSPDGSKIVFISDRDYRPEIYVMNADGSDQKRLTDSDSAIDIAPVWSPEGNKILFSSNRSGYFDLYSIDVNDGSTEQLTNSEYHEFYGSWSPNGSRIAYLSTEHGEPHLYLMNADGRRKRQLTR